MSVTGSFPGQALQNLLCRDDFPVPLEHGAGHALTRFSHFLCWSQGFSDRFAFYSRGGERSDNSELQKGCHLFLSKHQEKVLLLPDEKSVSPTSPKQRHVLSLRVANWRRQNRAGGLILLPNCPIWVKTLFRTAVMGPKVFHLFSSFTLKKAHPFSTLNPSRLALSPPLLFHVTQPIITYNGGEETKQFVIDFCRLAQTQIDPT